MTETSSSSGEVRTQSLRQERLTTIGVVIVVAAVFLLPIGLLSFGETFQYSVGPTEIESTYTIRRQKGNAFAIFNRVLVFSDDADYEISNPGYASETVSFVRQSDQRGFDVQLTPLPGFLDVIVTKEFPVSIHIDGEVQTRLEGIELVQGRHVVAVMRGDAELAAYAVDIEGFGNSQEILLDLSAHQAILSVTTRPLAAAIELDGERLGRGMFEGGVPATSHQLRISHAGYDATVIDISLERGQKLVLGTVELTPSLITTTIETRPSNASVLLDGSFVGESSTSFTLRPGRSYELVVRKPGYREHNAMLTPEIGKNISQTIDFEQKTIRVEVHTNPSATVLVNGIPKGTAPIALDVYPGDVIEARSEGLTSQSKQVSDKQGANQSMAFELLEPAAHAYHFADERVTVTGGLEMIRFPPVSYQKSVGVDSDDLMSIEITRPFYLGATEVTVGAFRLYQNSIQGSDKHPVSGISWTDAVGFCNWLSAQHDLLPFYRISPNGVIEGLESTSLGFRLPTEAEWETGAGFDWRRNLVLEPFEWGRSQTIPVAFANLAGRETSKVRSRHFDDFMDNHETEAPVASYLPNVNGLYDMSGNVSEWTHDYYQIRRETNGGPDYLGPRTGFANVVKGSNYETHEIDEVATSYREFETGRSPTLGFRVARWLY